MHGASNSRTGMWGWRTAGCAELCFPAQANTSCCALSMLPDHHFRSTDFPLETLPKPGSSRAKNLVSSVGLLLAMGELQPLQWLPVMNHGMGWAGRSSSSNLSGGRNTFYRPSSFNVEMIQLQEYLLSMRRVLTLCILGVQTYFPWIIDKSRHSSLLTLSAYPFLSFSRMDNKVSRLGMCLFIPLYFFSTFYWVTMPDP